MQHSGPGSAWEWARSCNGRIDCSQIGARENDGASYTFERISTVAHNMTNTHEEPLRALAAKEEEGSGPTAASAAVGTASNTQPISPLAPLAAVLASTALAACGGGSGGADLHDNLVAQQPNLMRRVSEAMTAFYDATVELGVADKVTAFTASDFGRTLSSNGDGSDHGWGSHHFMVGGAVKGRASMARRHR